MSAPRTLPRVAITCSWEAFIDSRGAPAERYLLGAPYIDAVLRAGGLPLILPHQPPALAAAALAGCDALIVSGGDFDIPPEDYDQAPKPGLGGLCRARTAFEAALLRQALAGGLPILGICGGMQLLNVVQGGSLHQDLAQRPASGHHQQPKDKRQPFHAVQLLPGSRLLDLLGPSIAVNSTHHQALDRLGQGLSAVGHAPDGVVEAIEMAAARFVIGVQWHPECLAGQPHQPLYDALVAAACCPVTPQRLRQP